MELLQLVISLTEARFFAYHGYYPEEQVLGNEFLVSVTAHMALSPNLPNASEIEEQLDDTINYAQLYEISKTAMSIPRKLLETVASDILLRVRNSYPQANEISISIRKTHPPFGGDLAQATVTLNWKI
ncbi:dihydroneopterin aldolase [bacterium A37T11]|nr:dihydroneopterin aldolase [bacterium A37T11]